MRLFLSALVPSAPILGTMDITAPRPELWTRIAALLGALRTLLRGAVPEHFHKIADDARAQLLAATALVRRYIHVLAAEITLPPLPVGVSPKPAGQTPTKHQARRDALFRLTELVDTIKRASKPGGSDTPFTQWALMMEAARRLALVLNYPEKHALRLARLLRRQARATLKDLPIPASILRRLAPWTDALLCRLDEEARPHAWAGINAQGPPADAALPSAKCNFILPCEAGEVDCAQRKTEGGAASTNVREDQLPKHRTQNSGAISSDKLPSSLKPKGGSHVALAFMVVCG